MGARLARRDADRIVVDLDEGVDLELVAAIVAVERECCPFFEISWQADVRRLEMSVASAEHAQAIDAIEYALGL